MILFCFQSMSTQAHISSDWHVYNQKKYHFSLHYTQILLSFQIFPFQPSSINPALNFFNIRRSMNFSYLITDFQKQTQPQKLDLGEGGRRGENICMHKQSPTYQLSSLLCALKRHLTPYKRNKFVIERDVVSNSVCASLLSSELRMPGAQPSLLCYKRERVSPLTDQTDSLASLYPPKPCISQIIL